MTRKTIESTQAQSVPTPIAWNRSCQRSMTHETATYRNSSTQLLLGRWSRTPGRRTRRAPRGRNGQRHRVVPAGVEGMAAQQPAQRQPAAPPRAVELDGLDGVGAAGGAVAARRR